MIQFSKVGIFASSYGFPKFAEAVFLTATAGIIYLMFLFIERNSLHSAIAQAVKNVWEHLKITGHIPAYFEGRAQYIFCVAI